MTEIQTIALSRIATDLDCTLETAANLMRRHGVPIITFSRKSRVVRATDYAELLLKQQKPARVPK